MWADVNIKPLQGTLFRVMRDKLMHCGVDYKDGYWAEQPVATKQPGTRKQTGVLKNSKPDPGARASAHECVGQTGCLKDFSHGS